MKKISIKMYIMILLSAISIYAVSQILWFNTSVMNYFETNSLKVLHFVLAIAINLVYVLAAKILIQRDIKKQFPDNTIDDDSKKRLESCRRKFLIINSTVSFVEIIALFLYCFNMYVHLTSSYGHLDSNMMPNVVGVLIIVVITVLLLIPSTIIINTTFKCNELNNKKMFKILRICRNVCIALVLLACFSAIVFVFLPINAFKYKYVYNDKYDGYVIDGFIYQDIRNCYKTELTIPKTIFGKRVVRFGTLAYMENLKKLILPNTLSVDTFANGLLNTVDNSNFDIYMYGGEPIEWYIKDNVIYDKDNRCMYFITKYKEKELFIPNTIEGVFSYDFAFNKFIPQDTKILIADDNPYFYEYGNVIWSKGNNHNINSFVPTLSGIYSDCDIGIIPFNADDSDKVEITILPDSNKPLCLYSSFATYYGIKSITIPKGYSNPNFEYINDYCTVIRCDKYIVEDGNPYYATYDGNLYTKDLKRLIAIRNYYNEPIKFSNEIEDISLMAIKQINLANNLSPCSVEANDNLIYENGNLYTRNYEKLLLVFDKEAEKLIINKNVNNISSSQLDYEVERIKGYEKYKIADRYCWSGDSGDSILNSVYMTSSEHPELLAISAVDANIFVPKELEKIDNRLYSAICLNELEIESGCKYYESQDNMVFTKGKEELIAVYKYGEKVYIPAETKYISDEALSSMLEQKIECDINNHHYEVYRGSLYTKGREKLLCFGFEDKNKIVIAKETKEIDERMLIAIVERHLYDNNGTIFEYVVEDGNEVYSTYDGCLYENNFEKLLLLNKIGFFDSTIISVHPSCKYISQIAKSSISVPTLEFDFSSNPYIEKTISEGYRLFYYPEYAYLNQKY